MTSREPLYDPKRDRVSDNGLVGTWTWQSGPGCEPGEACADEYEPFEQVKWRFERDGVGGYILAHSVHVEGRAACTPPQCCDNCELLPLDLVRIGRARYLFVTGEAATNMPAYRIERRGNELRICLLAGSQLREMLLADPHPVRHHFRPHESWTVASPQPGWVLGTLALEDSAARIRRLLTRHQRDGNLWIGPIVLRRE